MSNRIGIYGQRPEASQKENGKFIKLRLKKDPFMLEKRRFPRILSLNLRYLISEQDLFTAGGWQGGKMLKNS